MVGQENSFSSSDLLKYAELLIRETKQHEARVVEQSNYGWLKGRHLQNDDVINELDVLIPMIRKLSPESSTSVAVKLDRATEDFASTSTIISTLKNLLEEEQNSLIVGSVKEKRSRTKVQPVLTKGRQAVVSFVLEVKY